MSYQNEMIHPGDSGILWLVERYGRWLGGGVGIDVGVGSMCKFVFTDEEMKGFP